MWLVENLCCHPCQGLVVSAFQDQAVSWLHSLVSEARHPPPLLSFCSLLLQIRDLYMTFRNFKARIADFLRFRCVPWFQISPSQPP